MTLIWDENSEQVEQNLKRWSSTLERRGMKVNPGGPKTVLSLNLRFVGGKNTRVRAASAKRDL